MLDPRSCVLSYASAGHTPGFIFTSDGQLKLTLVSAGVPLRVGEDQPIHSVEQGQPDSGYRALLLTSGVGQQAHSSHGEFSTTKGPWQS